MGIESVAVYSDADADAPHTRAADSAFPIGPAAASESYLNVDSILAAASASGADAVHPGFGFLSENADFVRACTGAGLTFIGPSPEAMEAMGDKAAARKVAESVGVPCVPGSGDALSDPSDIEQAARSLELPVLLKAAAGGGGKGMRKVDDWDSLGDAIGAAQREGINAFGDGRLIVERYFKPARHVEIQVFGDTHGNVVALGERECSLQRRHQKIVEESPSVALSPELRSAMQDAACRVASAVHYAGAGTVEFLLAEDGSFYFLEMNARLQVEHPVTEEVYGLDLVRMQVEVARGESLSITQEQVVGRGHAIEVRLYAEDPSQHFLPQPGPVLRAEWPNRPGVRIETGIESGSEITGYYDPMIAKVIANGSDREEARTRLIAALEETVILGVTTNQSFLIDLLSDPMFLEGATFTHSVEPWTESRQAGGLSDVFFLAAALAPRGSRSATLAAAEGAEPDNPWQTLGHWRNVR
jgi:acetyl/propionyl-CoA carboxylase alpha subunit